MGSAGSVPGALTGWVHAVSPGGIHGPFEGPIAPPYFEIAVHGAASIMSAMTSGVSGFVWWTSRA